MTICKDIYLHHMQWIYRKQFSLLRSVSLLRRGNTNVITYFMLQFGQDNVGLDILKCKMLLLVTKTHIFLFISVFT